MICEDLCHPLTTFFDLRRPLNTAEDLWELMTTSQTFESLSWFVITCPYLWGIWILSKTFEDLRRSLRTFGDLREPLTTNDDLWELLGTFEDRRWPFMTLAALETLRHFEHRSKPLRLVKIWSSTQVERCSRAWPEVRKRSEQFLGPRARARLWWGPLKTFKDL